MNWKKVGIIIGAIIIPGGITALVGYKAYKHFTKPAVKAKPFTEFHKCSDCTMLIGLRYFNAWVNHLMALHGLTIEEAQATVHWLDKEVRNHD
jgi:hypothetical protein